MPDYTGQQFGNYRLLHLIGSGGFADVYLGEHTRLGMKAALKILHTHLMADDSELFLREARTISDLRHPHIIRVLDFDLQEGLPFLVLDYAPYGSLSQRHPRGSRVPLDQVVSYVGQMAQALQYAHDHHTIHRDIKPANMLIGDQDVLLLSDFGIATIIHATSSQKPQNTLGTLAYMAPEQMQGKSRPASDQYALAVTVYQWLTGELPFRGSSTEIIAQHLSAAAPSLRAQLPDLPEEVERVVLTALAKDPAERFSDVQSFAAALAQACQGSPAPSVARLRPSRLTTVQPSSPVAPARPAVARANPYNTVLMPPTNDSVPPLSLQAVASPGASQPSPQGNTAQPTVQPVTAPQTARRRLSLTSMSSLLRSTASTLIIPLCLLLMRLQRPDANNEAFFLLNILYCFFLGWLVARSAGKFYKTLLLSFLGTLFLLLAHGLIVMAWAAGYGTTESAKYVFYGTPVLMGAAMVAGVLGHGCGWLRNRIVQRYRRRAPDNVAQLATRQRLGPLVNSYPIRKESRLTTLSIGFALFVGLCAIVAFTIFHLSINYLSISLLLAAGFIISDMFREAPMAKVYLYTDGLIVPTPSGPLALHWGEISYMASPHVLICRSGTQVTLPEVTEDFQQLHETIQQQISRTQPGPPMSSHA